MLYLICPCLFSPLFALSLFSQQISTAVSALQRSKHMMRSMSGLKFQCEFSFTTSVQMFESMCEGSEVSKCLGTLHFRRRGTRAEGS